MARFAYDNVCKQNVDYDKEQTATGHDREDYGKIPAGNIIAWAHPEQG